MPVPEGRRFQPGQSGNPGGRPKGYAAFREQIRELTPEALEALRSALSDPRTRLSAALAIFDYGWGRPQPPERTLEELLSELSPSEPRR